MISIRVLAGLLAVVGAWLGGMNEFPLGQYDAQPEKTRGRA
jgi:hypothetical protein